jgi:hypothetical protein
MIFYPAYISVKIGTVDFTVCRIVILAVYLNLFLRTHLVKQFKLIWLDKLLIVYFIAQVLAGATTTPVMSFLEYQAGLAFDVLLPYFAARMILTSKEKYLLLLKSIIIMAIPLAIVGFYQCVTGDNPVGFLSKYKAWDIGREYVPVARHGFFRANVTFSHSILFGLFFAMLGPVCIGLLPHMKRNKLIYTIGIGLMGVGMVSSVSSGPLLTAVFAIMFISLWRWRKYWKSAIAIVILTCALVEIISNRHFYAVIDRVALASSASWYRARLLEVALFEGGMSGHWVTGYGFTSPGWGSKIDGRSYSDVTNHYLIILCRYGLVGLVPFLTLIGVAIKRIILAYKICDAEQDRWLVWCLSGGLLGVLGGMYGVMLNGQAQTFFFIILACCGIMPSVLSFEQKNHTLGSNYSCAAA